MDIQCKIDGCDKLARYKHIRKRQLTSASGTCNLHYKRIFYHSDPFYILDRKSLRHHNLSEYNIRLHMIRRCTEKTSKEYHNYGGRGIRVCDRWLESFENFLEDMGNRPSDRHSIDRIDNNGDYEPGNCRWATYKEQALNKRTTKLITVGGVSDTLRGHALSRGLKYTTVWNRLHMYNYNIEEALSCHLT